MSKPKIVVVTPTIRPECHAAFVTAWESLFERHGVVFITVWDGEKPRVQAWDYAFPVGGDCHDFLAWPQVAPHRDLFCRFSDCCRNLGFLYAAGLIDKPDFILTLDDDCFPPAGSDPIQEHLDVLARRVPLSWMNTAMPVDHSWGGAFKNGDTPYLRGVPYGVRNEAPVMLSHGVWVNVPDFDGETQLALEAKGLLPYTLPYYRGPIPRGTLFPLCGMNVMVRREALPHLYFAPMGPDVGVEGIPCSMCVGRNQLLSIVDPGPCPQCGSPHGTAGRMPSLNRFGDIWLGVTAKADFDALGWAMYSGAAIVVHQRASDARKNYEQEKLGRLWNEWIAGIFFETTSAKTPGYATVEFWEYMRQYTDKRTRYAALIKSLLGTS